MTMTRAGLFLLSALVGVLSPHLSASFSHASKKNEAPQQLAEISVSLFNYGELSFLDVYRSTKTAFIGQLVTKSLERGGALNSVFTRYEFEVIETIKSDPGSRFVQVLALGGSLDGHTHSAGLPIYDLGDVAFVMLGSPNEQGDFGILFYSTLKIEDYYGETPYLGTPIERMDLYSAETGLLIEKPKKVLLEDFLFSLEVEIP